MARSSARSARSSARVCAQQRARALSDTVGDSCDTTGGGHDTVSCVPRYSLARTTTQGLVRGLGAVGAQLRVRVCT